MFRGRFWVALALMAAVANPAPSSGNDPPLPIAGRQDPDPAEPGKEAPAPVSSKQTLKGRVVFLAEAIERRFGIKSVAEAKLRTLAMECRDGRLIPLVEDLRGRAFRIDPRLRAFDEVELLVQRHPLSPAAQVIRLYARRDGERVEVDYWCEICSIAMFELKACDCCQGDIELRLRPAPRK